MILVLAGLLAWCVLPLPFAVLVGRALAGRGDSLDRPEQPERPVYDLAA